MSNKNTYAEFHDIGKLINWKALGLQKETDHQRLEPEPHDFEKCMTSEWGIDNTKPPWQAIWRKFPEKHLPNSYQWLCTSIADELAAGWVRTIPENELKKESKEANYLYKRHCLWTGKDYQDQRLQKMEELKEMITFLNSSPSWEEAEKKYGELWSARAESKIQGLDVTSLRFHSIIVGKLARVLEELFKNLPESEVPKPDWLWKDKQDKNNPRTITNAIQKIKLTVCHFQVQIRQKPYRVSEWNIFQELQESLQKAIRNYPDNIISQVGNECIGVFIFPEQAQKFAEQIYDEGFNLVVREANLSISELVAHNLIGKLGETKYFYPKKGIPEKIELPLCETCQMAHAEYRWPADKLALIPNLNPDSKKLLQEKPWRNLTIQDFPLPDQPALAPWLEEQTEEHLCSTCFNLRINASHLTKLAKWEETAVAWIYIELNLEKLKEALKNLHIQYLKKCYPDTNLTQKVKVSFPLLADFFDDFHKFLKEFSQNLKQLLSENNVEQVGDNLYCISLEKRSLALKLLEIYNSLMNKFFPVLILFLNNSPCPISFSLSISNLKHPFFAHWRFLSQPENDVNIQIVESGNAYCRITHLTKLLVELSPDKRRALHRLREIASTSPTLAEIILRDTEDEDQESFETIRDLIPEQIDFPSLFTLTNLLERE